MLRISVRWDVMERPLELARAHNGDALPKCLFCRLNGPSWSASFLLQSKNRAPCNRSVFRHDAPAGQMTKRGLHRKFLGKKKKKMSSTWPLLSASVHFDFFGPRGIYLIFLADRISEKFHKFPFLVAFYLKREVGVIIRVRI